ncbi:unnamed protein product [Urochloa decumbens]|uniref:Fe2OG dioxygenase domain-containing protein n=1 Tax=Urochloa decumbens TaxID=240449 RepID=A0ABC9GD88_9POAL
MLKMKEEDEEEWNPPLMATYKHLLDDPEQHRRLLLDNNVTDDDEQVQVPPVIDLHDDDEQCRAAMIVRAASEWGFFQVTNHGVPQPLLDELHQAQLAVFRRPFQRKLREPLLGLESSPESYRWGTPTATCLEQLSWSEAYHIPLMTIMTPGGAADTDTKTRALRLVIEEVSAAMSKLALQLAGILVAGIDEDEAAVAQCTRISTCFLRLNRYPAAAESGGPKALFGLCPHTDSDFLTIVHQQDAVGGLQLLNKAGRWVAVRPNPGALIVNVGDLLQAWSNDRYRSVEHRVVLPSPSAATDRFSAAFFLCPAYDTLIRPRCCSGDPPRYRSFTFGEYRNQIKEDVRLTGRKLGLQRFRLHQEEDTAAAHCDFPSTKPTSI